jgi:hypothetical protein
MATEIKTVNVGSYLNQAGKVLISALGKALPRTTDATKELRQSIRFTIRPFGLTYTFELYLADYYEYVDKGRRAGKMPPVDSIIKWIADKRFVFNKGKLQRNTANSKLVKVSDNLSLSKKIGWAIARKIAREGTKGNQFYSSTVPPWVENLKKELPKILKRDILIEIREAVQ